MFPLIFREKKEKEKKEEEKEGEEEEKEETEIGCLPYLPQMGIESTTEASAPWMEIKLANFQCRDQCSEQLSQATKAISLTILSRQHIIINYSCYVVH